MQNRSIHVKWPSTRATRKYREGVRSKKATKNISSFCISRFSLLSKSRGIRSQNSRCQHNIEILRLIVMQLITKLLYCRMITPLSHQFNNHHNHGHFKIANLTKEKDSQSNRAKKGKKRPHQLAIYPMLQASSVISLKSAKLRIKATLTMSGQFLVRKSHSCLQVAM